MKVGVPKEIKDQEYRVALTPDGAAALVAAGHHVVVERSAGAGSGFDDAAYLAAGAEVADTADAWNSELVLKVKEPLPGEYPYLGSQIVFTFFHLAGVDSALTDVLLRAGTTAVAYETLEDDMGRLPLLAPMSAVAGNMAVQMGAYYLARVNGGRGTQLGTVLGRSYGDVWIVGDGVVGSHAARTALGLGAAVTLVGLDPARGPRLKNDLGDRLVYRVYDPESLAEGLRAADLVVGAILHKGARADYVIDEAMVRSMPTGAVIVDVSIDQGGCVETSRPTSFQPDLRAARCRSLLRDEHARRLSADIDIRTHACNASLCVALGIAGNSRLARRSGLWKSSECVPRLPHMPRCG